jgi:hypothetical protein
MTPQTLRQGKSEEKLTRIIDEVLNQVLGHKAARTFYAHLENTHAIHRHEIALQLDLFNFALKEYFGAGSAVLEQTIRRNLEFATLEQEAELVLSERARVLKLA